MAPKVDPETSTAPDGGWGWFVVLGYALNNMVVLPIIQIFGLLYRDLLLYLKMSNMDISIIIATNISCGMLLAIFNGPILRACGFRKVAIIGSLLVFIGNYQTSQADSFWEFILYFSVFVSIGTNMVMAAFNLALNTYFVVKRGVATGVAMSITGLGPILMPLLTSSLMSSYGNRGAGMILSALSLHALVAALLLQPVKWHRRKIADTPLREGNRNKGDSSKTNNEVPKEQETTFITVKVETVNKTVMEDEVTAATKLMVKEDAVDKKRPSVTQPNDDDSPPLKSLDDIVKRQQASIWERIVKFFDFDLLSDVVYLNISFGLSLAFVTEMSFSLMLPLILLDRGFDSDSAAVMLSTLAGADIVSRFISPFIGESVKSKVRVVYLFSLLCGIFFRICLIYAQSFVSILLVIIMLGMTKGIRSVYTALVLPTYVPLQKLASATGLQMVVNGLMLGIFGPVLGFVRDSSQNYDLWIHVINFCAWVTVVLWFTEMFVRRKAKTARKVPIVKQ